MDDGLRTRTCAACGFPTLAAMRRCPFCREALPKVRAPRVASRFDPLLVPALLWALLLVPVTVLVGALVGLPYAAPFLLAMVAPAAFVLMLGGRAAWRIRRFRGPSARRATTERPSAAESGTSQDAQRR